MSSLQQFIVAVDGGGSSTRLWVLDTQGGKIAEGRGGPSTVTVVGIDAAVQAVADAARAAGLAPDTASVEAVDGSGGRNGASGVGTVGDVAAAAAVVAGADREPEYSGLLRGIERLFPNGRAVVRHDALGALLGGTLGEPGILLLSGTGSVCLSLGPDGEQARVGGWGPLLDDVGSGYWIGREAIRRALRAADGRDVPSVLTMRLAEVAGVADVRDLSGAVHRGDFDRPWIARLAPLVAQAAAEGDAAADEILNEAAVELAAHVRAALARSPWFDGVDDVPVVAAGGIYGLGDDWRRRVREALAKQAPRARLTFWIKEPIVGAVFLALQAYYGTIPADVMRQLQQLREDNVERLDM